jgi:hypothetical protein
MRKSRYQKGSKKQRGCWVAMWWVAQKRNPASSLRRTTQSRGIARSA